MLAEWLPMMATMCRAAQACNATECFAAMEAIIANQSDSAALTLRAGAISKFVTSITMALDLYVVNGMIVICSITCPVENWWRRIRPSAM
jgi:hypothetical protein